jgi:hypothetical protein
MGCNEQRAFLRGPLDVQLRRLLQGLRAFHLRLSALQRVAGVDVRVDGATRNSRGPRHRMGPVLPSSSRPCAFSTVFCYCAGSAVCDRSSLHLSGSEIDPWPISCFGVMFCPVKLSGHRSKANSFYLRIAVTEKLCPLVETSHSLVYDACSSLSDAMRAPYESSAYVSRSCANSNNTGRSSGVPCKKTDHRLGWQLVILW